MRSELANELKCGDKVLLINVRRARYNKEYKRDKYLGKVVTIVNYCSIQEDNQEWFWLKLDFACKIVGEGLENLVGAWIELENGERYFFSESNDGKFANSGTSILDMSKYGNCFESADLPKITKFTFDAYNRNAHDDEQCNRVIWTSTDLLKGVKHEKN